MGKRKLAALVCVSILVTVLAACTPSASTEAPTDGGGDNAATMIALSPQTDPYNPIITTLEDGTQIQRTPNDSWSVLDGGYTYHSPDEDNTVPYNTYYLDADSRGCNSCHADLAQTLESMRYDHVSLSNALGIEITYDMCVDCHTFGFGYIANQYSFGSLVHGIHDDLGGQDNCWSCHVATGSGDGMQIWDEVKHEQLRGILPVSEVQGEFSYSQDKTIAAGDLFDFGWLYFDWDYTRHENEETDAPLDEEMFDTWTITFSGAVDSEVTYTLPELIEKYGTEDFAYTLHCTLNATGGPLLGNCNYTGIALKPILEELGADTTTGAITAIAPDGFIEPAMMDKIDGAYLAIAIDGEPLSWAHGYPVQLVVQGSGAPASVKEVSDIIVNTAEEAIELHEWNGWPKEAGEGDYYTTEGWPYVDTNGYMNKPNVGIMNFYEGQIVETGIPYTFTGYAHGWDENIVALEFSMDGGVTWTRYETPGTTNANWVIWEFAYTPEEDFAYVLSIRAVAEDGSVTEDPIERLFNAKTSGSDDGSVDADSEKGGEDNE